MDSFISFACFPGSVVLFIAAVVLGVYLDNRAEWFSTPFRRSLAWTLALFLVAAVIWSSLLFSWAVR